MPSSSSVSLARLNRAWAPRSASAKFVPLPMPATVIKVNVKPGDSVRAGEVVVLLEAMKMELPVRSPVTGRVTSVNCREGELVQAGVILLEIED